MACIPIAVLTPVVDDMSTISDRHAGVQDCWLNEPTLLSAALEIDVGVLHKLDRFFTDIQWIKNQLEPRTST